MTQTTLRMPADLYRRAKNTAAISGKSINQFFVEIIHAYLKESVENDEK